MRLVEEIDAEGEVSAELVAKEAGIDVEVARRIVAGRLRTPVASCADFLNSDHSAARMPCTVSFLLCFACRNAVATGRYLPRIAYLHQALESLRSAVTPAVWAADWATHLKDLFYALVKRIPSPKALSESARARADKQQQERQEHARC
ncbi:hypothetical protein [Streptomyces europaeiscabiei]|uniref:hypothetical protein n=1 Tax=Streptomyces europaeiscabiei TaxID=146819 RepID=UPI002E19F682